MLEKNINQKKIVLVGGGTGGSVAPLLAVAETFRAVHPDACFLLIGMRDSQVEERMASSYNFFYRAIHAGKLRRYFDWQNFVDFFKIIIGFFQAISILREFAPQVIFSAGSFISVPVAWAAYFLKIPVVAHQQDIIPSFSNKLILPIAKKITISHLKSLKDFPAPKSVFTGNPVRKNIIEKADREVALKRFNLSSNLPTVLILGGGTGSIFLNTLVDKTLPSLLEFCQVIHLTGGRVHSDRVPFLEKSNHYWSFEFLTDDMPLAYAASDLVVSRAGLGALTELSALGKPAIIIPMPDSHQEYNAQYFADQEAVIYLKQKELQPNIFLEKIQSLLRSKDRMKILGEKNLFLYQPLAAKKIVEILEQFC